MALSEGEITLNVQRVEGYHTLMATVMAVCATPIIHCTAPIVCLHTGLAIKPMCSPAPNDYCSPKDKNYGEL